ncbi:putative ribonuclease H [Aureococcus anophagefferens virus]|uniref:Putative ribonuclease H n=1 Tax=Aureococcus anophagefferens virus TaxID=1474867 RepID=A0A076FFU4_9VIRU|nr:putative ribonuclease H [Aureococcus anophagefferens virus]AII17154.1 putative ribonuclease H [Aureococcus anophagefferens virus]UOG94154.1 hypothetical protein MKD35_113 [Aureococcus anophagefferens virus]
MTILFIDTGYFCFYRYHACKRWFSFQDERDQVNSWQNEEIFRNCLMKQVEKNLKKYSKNKSKVYIALEAMDGDNWRKNICSDYKANRTKNEDIFEFMKYVYDYFRKISVDNDLYEILQIPCHEADDCIALKCRELLNANSNEEITILTSDTDFLQLVENDNNVKLMNATEKFIDKPIVGQLYLKHKIIEGDKSDNIKPIFSGKGKTKNIQAVIEKIKDITLNDVNESHFNTIEDFNKFQINRKLIDFAMIEMN